MAHNHIIDITPNQSSSSSQEGSAAQAAQSVTLNEASQKLIVEAVKAELMQEIGPLILELKKLSDKKVSPQAGQPSTLATLLGKRGVANLGTGKMMTAEEKAERLEEVSQRAFDRVMKVQARCEALQKRVNTKKK